MMPTSACEFYYECKSCVVLLRPLAGDCCEMWIAVAITDRIRTLGAASDKSGARKGRFGYRD